MDLCDDIIVEVYKKLDFDLHSFYSTCRRFYNLFNQHKNTLLTEGNYRFTPSQLKLVENLNNNVAFIDTGSSKGMKAAVLHFAFNYPCKVHIGTPVSEYKYWEIEIERLYRNSLKKSLISFNKENRIIIGDYGASLFCKNIYYKKYGNGNIIQKSNPIINSFNLECYRNETVDYVYLSPLTVDHRPQTKRLYETVDKIVKSNRGDFIII